MKRTPLRSIGERVKRRTEARKAFREAVLARAQGRCERCFVWGLDPHAHHILPVSRGGTERPENGAALCFRCHGAVHDHTAPDWDKWVR